MDLLLIAITIGALALALGASVVAWRASRDEKVRAAARVAALSVAAGVPPLQADAAEATTSLMPQPDLTWRGADRSVHLRKRPARRVPTARELEAFASEAQAPDVILPGQFLGADAAPRESVGRQRWLAAAAAVVAVLLGGFVVLADWVPARAATARHTAAPTPLELLSLGHEREGNNLSVTGLVRKPAAGAAVERVTAVVFLFDQQGTFVTSAKAPTGLPEADRAATNRRSSMTIAAPTIGGALSRELPDR